MEMVLGEHGVASIGVLQSIGNQSISTQSAELIITFKQFYQLFLSKRNVNPTLHRRDNNMNISYSNINTLSIFEMGVVMAAGQWMKRPR